MNKFELTSAYQPTGDQPEAIAQLTEGVREGLPAQTLLGVTGSGKTFTIANVIANIKQANADIEPQQDAGCPVVQRVSRDSSRTMPWNTMCPTTTTISPKPTCHHRTPI